MRGRAFLISCVAAAGLHSSWAAVPDRPAITPPPRIGEWLAGAGTVQPLVVETAGRLKKPATRALWRTFAARLPGGTLPAEGYLLEVGSRGATAVVADATGRIRLGQTLRQLPAGGCPNLRIADWPDLAWRGLHVLDSGPKSLPRVLRLIHEILPAAKANALVYEIDYNFRFTSHPEIPGPDAWTRTQIGELVTACRAEGIRLIPEINCLGHQSWKQPPGELLKAHPELEEIPDGKTPETDLTKDAFYCRSWCISHPDTNRIVFALMDELIDAFQTDGFHVGMDEVFVIASDACPRCKGKDPAKLFASQVNALHEHLARRKIQMLMWADRLIDGKATSYGDWDASTNGTAPAIDLVPNDIIQCDWHYDFRESYPSLDLLPAHGFRMWPTVYSDLRGARKFMAEAKARKDESHILGVLTSIWVPADRMAGAILNDPAVEMDGGARNHARTAVAALHDAWSGAEPDLTIAPAKTTFLDPIDVTITATGAIRYTIDGTLPSLASPAYTLPVHLTDSATLTAALVSADGVSMRTVTRRYERLVPLPASGPAKRFPGVAWAAFDSTPPGFERTGDLAGRPPNRTGTAASLDLAVAGRRENYGLIFTGWLMAPRDGLYTFTLSSDDGSRLVIDGRLVVNADGLHQARPETGEVALQAGLHRFELPFIQAGGGASLGLEWEGPGFARAPVPVAAFTRP